MEEEQQQPTTNTGVSRRRKKTKKKKGPNQHKVHPDDVELCEPREIGSRTMLRNLHIGNRNVSYFLIFISFECIWHDSQSNLFNFCFFFSTKILIVARFTSYIFIRNIY